MDWAHVSIGKLNSNGHNISGLKLSYSKLKLKLMLSNISYNQDLPQDLFHGQSYDPFIQGVHLEAICDCPTFMLGYFSDRSSNP